MRKLYELPWKFLRNGMRLWSSHLLQIDSTYYLQDFDKTSFEWNGPTLDFPCDITWKGENNHPHPFLAPFTLDIESLEVL